MKRSKGLSTEQTTSPPPEIFISIPQSGGAWRLVNLAKDAGLISTPESKNGISELSTILTEVVQYEISSAIELFISTDLIPFLHKQSPGDLKALLQKFVLEVRSSSSEACPGPSYSCRYMIRLSSKSPSTGPGKRLLSVPLSLLLKTLCLTPTPSPSSGESPQVELLGENVSE